MEIPLLDDIVVIFGLSIAVLFIFHRIRVPAIVGFLLTGILAGPHGLGLIKDPHQVEILAEIGVVLLLFAIGLEFSLKSMSQIKEIDPAWRLASGIANHRGCFFHSHADWSHIWRIDLHGISYSAQQHGNRSQTHSGTG